MERNVVKFRYGFAKGQAVRKFMRTKFDREARLVGKYHSVSS